jgi:4-hydroxybenzoate polyprenyltransferase
MRAFFELIRLPAVFTAPADVLAGLALGGAFVSGGRPAVEVLLPGLAVVAASVCIYAAGMAANDVFDLAVDRVERPQRPIPSGRIGVRAAWTWIVGLQLAGLALSVLGGGGATGATCLATIAATYLYNGLLKSGPLGPLSMGLCRYGNAMIGVTAAGLVAPPPIHACLVPVGTLLYVAALTGVSRHEVSGTPGPGLRAALVALVVLSITPAVAALAGVASASGAWAALAAPLFLWRPVRRAWGGGGGAVRGAVMAGIFGIALVDAAIAIGAGAPIVAGIIVGLAAAGRRFGRWFHST